MGSVSCLISRKNGGRHNLDMKGLHTARMNLALAAEELWFNEHGFMAHTFSTIFRFSITAGL
jgi:hypothetical protein